MRTAVLTGSASGMGNATAALLAARGWRVIGVDQREADIEADLSTRDGRTAAIAAARDLAGDRLDAAVTFAGVSGFAGRQGSLVVSVNYFGAVELMDGFRPLLAAAGAASAVVISSNAATTTPGIDDALVQLCIDGREHEARARADALGGPASYSASKLAVARWARRTAPSSSWIGEGIALNVVAPGKIETPLVAEMSDDPTGQAILARLPLPAQRAGRPEEIAALVEYLLGEQARFIVGSVIHIDGGTDAFIRPDDWPVGRPARSGRPR